MAQTRSQRPQGRPQGSQWSQWLVLAVLSVALFTETVHSAALRAHSSKGATLGFPFESKFLIVSSPKEQKVCYTALTGSFEAEDGHVLPLVDSGLQSPHGIAIDRREDEKLGSKVVLFIADPQAKKIFQYTVRRMKNGKKTRLITDGRQLVVVENVEAYWVSVDARHNLLFTEKRGNRVSMLPFSVLEKLEKGLTTAADIVTMNSIAPPPIFIGSTAATRAPVAKDSVTVLYSDQTVSTVGDPQGVSADGVRVYWTNSRDGNNLGSVVKGYEATPFDAGATGNPADTSVKLASNIRQANGIVVAGSTVFYTSDRSMVYGVPSTGGPPVLMTDEFDTPRGLAWDGDGTIYVADQTGGGGQVYSFASGRLAPTPIHVAVALHDAYGLAVVQGDALPLMKNSATSVVGPWVVTMAILCMSLLSN